MAKPTAPCEAQSDQQEEQSSVNAPVGEGPYDIGYGKAPKHARFKPGQ